MYKCISQHPKIKKHIGKITKEYYNQYNKSNMCNTQMTMARKNESWTHGVKMRGLDKEKL